MKMTRKFMCLSVEMERRLAINRVDSMPYAFRKPIVRLAAAHFRLEQ